MINWKAKLSSRKFWALLAGLAIAIMVRMGAPTATMTEVVAVITALGSIAIYMWGETSVDVARLRLDAAAKELEKMQLRAKNQE